MATCGVCNKPVRGTLLNPTHGLTQGMVGCLVMNEWTGRIVGDKSNYPDGDATLDPASKAVRFQWGWNGLYQTGTINHVVRHTTNYKPLDGLETWSVAVRVYSSDISVDNGLFYTERHAGTAPLLFWIDTAATNHFASLITTSGGGTGAVIGGIEALENTWYTLVLVKDSTQLRLYVNGIEDTAGGFPSFNTGTLDASTLYYTWGNDSTTSKELQGCLEFGYLWNRNLSPDEARSLSNDPYQMFQQYQAPARFWSPSGATGVTGTGSISATVPTLAGSGEVEISGTGAINATVPTLSGSGSVVVTGTGAIDATVPTLDGAGQVGSAVSGSGAIDATVPTLDGSGTVGDIVSGVGAIDSTVPTLAGAGNVLATGTGAAVAPAATMSGVGAVTEDLTGTGALTAPAAIMDGAGTLTITSTGALTAPVATMSGVGFIGSVVNGGGNLDAPAAQMSGVGRVGTYRGDWNITNVGIACLPNILKRGSNPDSYASGLFPLFNGPAGVVEYPGEFADLVSPDGYRADTGTLKLNNTFGRVETQEVYAELEASPTAQWGMYARVTPPNPITSPGGPYSIINIADPFDLSRDSIFQAYMSLNNSGGLTSLTLFVFVKDGGSFNFATAAISNIESKGFGWDTAGENDVAGSLDNGVVTLWINSIEVTSYNSRTNYSGTSVAFGAEKLGFGAGAAGEGASFGERITFAMVYPYHAFTQADIDELYAMDSSFGGVFGYDLENGKMLLSTVGPNGAKYNVGGAMVRDASLTSGMVRSHNMISKIGGE